MFPTKTNTHAWNSEAKPSRYLHLFQTRSAVAQTPAVCVHSLRIMCQKVSQFSFCVLSENVESYTDLCLELHIHTFLFQVKILFLVILIQSWRVYVVNADEEKKKSSSGHVKRG